MAITEDNLNKWSELLLDTGKRNNLINFRDTKSSTLEVIAPDVSKIFDKMVNMNELEVYEPLVSASKNDEDFEQDTTKEKFNKQEWIELYSSQIKRNQVLVFNRNTNIISVLKKLSKRAQSAIDETGINIAYITIGFIRWNENENSSFWYNAPILLIPIRIERESTLEPYKIFPLEDEVIVNPTFSFKLENEYDIKLPEYKDENLNEYFDKIIPIVEKMGWELLYECKIATFSFQKINMYRDILDNKSSILNNSNIKRLSGDAEYQDNVFDECISEDKTRANSGDLYLHNVVDADSSQIEAVNLAKKGVSFVLQGPPGTGKSQTITNIIAECINDGKKVLFVAEKLAALQVVYDKLRKADLDEFCLELHSNKANKSDVISELCRTMNAAKSRVNDFAYDEVENKKRNQKTLDEYAYELHSKRDVIGMSLYDIFEQISSCKTAYDVHMIIDSITSKNADYLNRSSELIEQYVQFADLIGYNYKNNCWYGFHVMDTSYQKKYEIENNLLKFAEFITIIIEECTTLRNNKNINIDTLGEYFDFVTTINNILNCNYLLVDIIKREDVSNLVVKAKKLKDIYANLTKLKSSVAKVFNEDVYALDKSYWDVKMWNNYSKAIIRLFNSQYHNAKRVVKKVLRPSVKYRYADINSYCSLLNQYYSTLDEFNKLSETLQSCLIEKFDVSKLDDYISQLAIIANIKDVNSYNLSTLLKKDELSKSDMDEMATYYAKINNGYKPCVDSINSYFEKAKFDINDILLEMLIKKINSCCENIGSLDNWNAFNQILLNIEQYKIVQYIDKMIENNVPLMNFLPTFKKAFYVQWADSIIHSSQILLSFNRVLQDKAVKDFAEKDKLQFEINKAEIKANLSQRRPQLNAIAGGSPAAILLRENEKKRKKMNIRTLFERLGSFVQVLKPCLLMSPLSVSTYLKANSLHFDVVIFDEASQIFPQDAIGSIYRGKQLIVVGDSKQMPPTNFFGNNYESDDDAEEDIADFESILDLCAASFPQIRLQWHYRSNYEQLISFSNKNFYDNSLITFPSNVENREDIGVDYYHVNGGIFDRKTKTNRKEAEFITDMVFEHYQKHPERSLGVVAFSASQQNLIEQLIDKRRPEHPELAEYFDSKCKEPFFVKNLETVQGDERDTIIFSVAYGQGSDGRLLMNFGPLTRNGGERRLNVAVTRAKSNVKLVTSMHYTDIDLSRTQSIGTKLLREYLDYAENGDIALDRELSVLNKDCFDSPFEMEVCDFLRDNGFIVDTQVGCSSFRIDLGVRKENTSDYVLAIECDGATYHSSKNARDRDRLRQEVLERMGWKFYRIWSTDWFKNKQIEKQKLLEECKKVMNVSIESNTSQNEEDLEISAKDFQEVITDINDDNPLEFEDYKLVNDYAVYMKTNYSKIRTIATIINEEAPISEEWLLKRICNYYGRERVTDVVRREFSMDYINVKRMLPGLNKKRGFFYIDGRNIAFRKSDDSKNRKYEYISLEELADGMYSILKANLFSSIEGLFKIIANNIGYSKVSKDMNEYFVKALSTLGNKIKIDDDRVELKEE